MDIEQIDIFNQVDPLASCLNGSSHEDIPSLKIATPATVGLAPGIPGVQGWSCVVT